MTDMLEEDEGSMIESVLPDPILEKLFGKKKYRYRMEAVETLPDTIFKERNVNIRVKLVDASD